MTRFSRLTDDELRYLRDLLEDVYANDGDVGAYSLAQEISREQAHRADTKGMRLSS